MQFDCTTADERGEHSAEPVAPGTCCCFNGVCFYP